MAPRKQPKTATRELFALIDCNNAFLTDAASERINFSVVEALLARGADPHARDQTLHTPIMRAANNGHAEAVRALIPHSDLRARENYGHTALHLAVMNGQANCVKLLCAADPWLSSPASVRGTAHGTPLVVACLYTFDETALTLLPFTLSQPAGLSDARKAAKIALENNLPQLANTILAAALSFDEQQLLQASCVKAPRKTTHNTTL